MVRVNLGMRFIGEAEVTESDSSTRAGMKHYTMVFKTPDGEFWYRCSCEGFQYRNTCEHVEYLNPYRKEEAT